MNIEQNLDSGKTNNQLKVKGKTEYEKGEISLLSYLYKLNKNVWKRGIMIAIIPFCIEIFLYLKPHSEQYNLSSSATGLGGIELIPLFILLFVILVTILAKLIITILTFYFSRKQ